MPITNEQVKKIETFTSDLGDFIKTINPVTDKEWDAFNKLVDAHKNLMKVPTDELRQLPLFNQEKKRKKAKPRTDCPRCKGAGAYIDPQDSTRTSRVCVCRDVEDEAWPQVKAAWEKQVAPVAER
jgi:hypothetical protein